MALPTVSYLLLLFSMLPLFADAWTQCSRRSGYYCPAGSDCNRNNSLCKSRSQNSTEAEERREECDKDIILRFTLSEFVVSEGNGPATPVIQINKALNCCSFSVIVLFEQLTADNNDYYHPSRGYERVIFSAGKDTAEMPVKVKDDDIVEISETFKVTIVKESLPHGVSLAQPSEAIVVIRDNDIGCVSLQRAAYTYTESTRAAKIDLRVDNAASFDYNVTFGTTDLSANKCDYAAGPHTATFKAGRKTTSLYIDIIDDDMHEGSETFNFFIDSFVAVIPAHEPFIDDALDKCYPHRGAVTINDDEGTICVRFDKSSYTVNEDVGTFSPELVLCRPSPCCVTVYIELIELTSSTAATGGGEDYGFSTTAKYEYIFPAGEIRAVPVNPIPIIDDLCSEKDEKFYMRIMQFSLPLGFTASTSSIPVTIKDNDINCSFSARTYSINENRGPLKVRLNLDKPAPQDFNVTIFDFRGNTTSQDYDSGPKHVIFKRYSRTAVLSIHIKPDQNETYTGNRVFSLFINSGGLPTGLVPGNIVQATVIIIDNEYTVCFSHRNVTVEEGERVKLTLSTSRRLSSPVSVRLIYTDGTTVSSGSNSDYFKVSSVSVSSSYTFYIRTRNDRILEYDETFTVSIPSELIHPNAPSCITTVNVTIKDNDDCAVEFERSFYPATSNKNMLLRPKLKLSNPIAYPIQVTLVSIDGTATRVEDYNILQSSPITIRPEDNQMKEFSIDTVDDDIVETLLEDFFVNITYVAHGDGGADHRVTIGEISSARFQIRDDDMSYVSIIDEHLVLSKEIYSEASIEICYFDEDRPPFIRILPPVTSSFDLEGPVNEIKIINFCIPQDILRRVISRHDKVKICTLQM